MSKRKERPIKQLYHATNPILEAQMTPVLRGNCRIQGPSDETDCSHKKTSSSQAEKGISRQCAAGNVGMQAESGTCNVCAAPCSSCRHFDQAVLRMEIKAENEFSDEVSGVNAATRCSFNEGVIPSFKKRARTDRKPACETSSTRSASSSHDPISETAGSRESVRIFDSKEDVEMLPKGSHGVSVSHDQILSRPQGVTCPSVELSSVGDVVFDAGQRATATAYEIENGGDASRVSGANDTPTLGRELSVDVDTKNELCTTFVSGFFPEGGDHMSRVQLETDRLAGFQYKRKDNCNNLRGANIISEHRKQKDHFKSSNESVMQKSDPSEILSSKDSVAVNSPQSLVSSFHCQSTKSNSSNADPRGFEEIHCSQLQVESSVCSVPCIESSSEKLEVSAEGQLLDKPKCEDATKAEDSKSNLIGTSWTSVKDNIDLEAGIVVDMAEPTTKCVQHLEKNEKNEQSSVSPNVLNNQDSRAKFQCDDGSDGSDILEDDVKVCDICGDAGREDLLAICSRCSDGAEHTYCMRIMMDKAPEGEWLCEVCKMNEEAEDQKKNKSEIVLGTAKASCLSKKTVKSVGTLDSKVSHKPDTEFPDKEGNLATKVDPHLRLPSKRQLDNLEVPFISKRQALESSIGPSNSSSPNKKSDNLSRERSFKNVDMGKVKPIHRMPSLGGSSSQDSMRPPGTSIQASSKIHPPHQSPRGKIASAGTLLKSSSFNVLNTKPKVKMVQEDVSQKNKLGKHHSTSGSRKEGILRTISRSSSFSSSHSTSVDSKAKGHSSNLSRAEDSRGIKLGKEWNVLERKSSIKSDRMVSPITGFDMSSAKDENKISSRGETLPSITKSCDPNIIQTDARLSTSKSACLPSHRGPETSNASGRRSDFKRPSSLVSRSGGYPSLNGNSAEREKSRVNLSDEIAAVHSCTADRPNSNSELVSQDGLPQSREFMGQGMKSEELSFNQSRNSVPAAARSLKEVTNRSMKSKDANEAVFIKNSGMCKTSGLPDISNEPSMPSAESICERTPKDQLSNALVSCGNLISSDGAYDRQDSFKKSTVEASKCTVSTNVNHNALKPHLGEGCAANEDLEAVVCSDGIQLRPSACNLQNRDPPVAIPPRVYSIPEPDYIWQGGFEVQRGGSHFNSFNGIQAHLSTCVSPKVIEVVNMFPHNVLLEEVTRLSTWPSQFKNCATEDSIALYFFAKDIESYIRNYQSLVENLMKHDLALRGVLNGVELLIFPSNQLSAKSKRWNTLYFLWGVFRAKRASTSEKIEFSVTQNGCSSSNIDEDLSMVERSSNGHGTIDSSALLQFPSSSVSGREVTNHYKGESSSVQNCSGLETKSGVGPADIDSKSILANSTSDVQLCSNRKGNGTSMLEHGHTERIVEPELQQSIQETFQKQSIQEARDTICNTGKTSLLNNPYCIQAGAPSPPRHDACSGLFKFHPDSTSSLSQDACAAGSEMEVAVPEGMTDTSIDDVAHREKVQDGEGMADADSTLKKEPLSDLVENDNNTCVVKSSRKRPHLAIAEMVPQASGEPSGCTNQPMLWKAMADDILVDKENECKKIKMVYSEAFLTDTSRGHNKLTERSLSQMPDLGSAFSINEQGFEGVYDGAMVAGSSITTEKYLFPVKAGPIKDVGATNNSIPVEVISSDDEDPLESERPNLDLALGGEKKPPKQKTGPLYELLAKKKKDHGKFPEIMTDNGEDDSLGSLSLSLAVPFSSEVSQIVRPIAKPEPKRSPIDTSLLLFRGFSNN